MVKMKKVYGVVALIALLAIGAGLWVSLGVGVTRAQAQSPTIDGKIAPGEYKFSYTDPDLKMELHWTIDDDFIYIGMMAPTKGWVGIGWRNGLIPEEQEEEMKDVDMYMGYVTGGQLSMLDAYGQTPTDPPTPDTQITMTINGKDVPGTDDILERAGSEDSSGTTIEFKRKLNTLDHADNPVPAQGEVYLAYGPNNADDFTTYHGSSRSEAIVNFVTGKAEPHD